MRIHASAEKWRVMFGPGSTVPGEDFGWFLIPGPCGIDLKVIISSGDAESGVDWEHVSVSTKKRCPNWQEMCFVKELFWDAEDAVMQLHPPRSQWINNHPYCLHMWRPTKAEIPMPPLVAV